VHLPVKVHTFDSFRYRDYRFIWGATASFSGAFWLQVVVIGWLTYSLTESALLTSIAMGLDALPILLIGPFGGVLVDSWDRRKLLIFAYGYQMVLTLSFSAIVFLDILQPWHIFGFIFMMGISWVINDPARMSLISTSVPRHHLVNAFALNSMAFSVTRLIAPAVGGAVLAFWGPGPALIVQAILQLGAVVSAYPIRATQANRAGLRLNKALSGIMEGVRYISKEPVILGLVALSGIPSVLVMPFIYGLLPVYAAEVFVVGPSTLGLLMASIGAGALVGTLVLASVGEIRRKGKVVVGCLALTGVGMLGFALNSSLAMAFPLIMVVSIGVMAFFSTASATIQSIVPDEFRGRVSGLYMLSFGFMPVGSVAAGVLAERFGGPGATVIGGGLVLLVLITLVFSFKAIWRLD